MKGRGFGLLGNIVGIIGAVVGGFLVRPAGISRRRLGRLAGKG
jgi:uncharacterized membrane protein YeaQ/YmgE (transglycosylase-associated protein family)